MADGRGQCAKKEQGQERQQQWADGFYVLQKNALRLVVFQLSLLLGPMHTFLLASVRSGAMNIP